MINIEQAVIVEGKYDKIKLSSVINGVIICTDGFHIFKDKEKMKLIRHYSEKKGIIILTDSDTAGFKIRNYLKGSVGGNIINVYIPDIFGKERRKDAPSKEGKLGVEGVKSEIILEALKKAGIDGKSVSPSENERKLVTKTDLFEDGICGKDNSQEKRKRLLKELSLPEHMSANAMLKIINSYLTYDDYKKAVREIGD